MKCLKNIDLWCGVSGGKDSTATALYLKFELGLDVQFYFADTKWENHLTLEYIDYLEGIIGKIHRLESEGFENIVKRKKIFPSKRIKYCTELLKIKPVKDFFGITTKTPRKDICLCVGERSQESNARANKVEFGYNDRMGTYMWLPIKDWTHEEVFEISKKYGVKYNPLYAMGYKRVGCFPCVMASLNEYKRLDFDFPDRVELIKKLEGETGAPFKQIQWQRIKKDGCTFISDITGDEVDSLNKETVVVEGIVDIINHAKKSTRLQEPKQYFSCSSFYPTICE